MNMSDQHDLEVVKAALERRMEQLYQRAYAVVEDYYIFKNERNLQADWPKKSSLKPRVRQRGLSIVMEWYDKRWYGSTKKGNRRPFVTYIAKPRGAINYTMSKLLGYAQDWEREKVIETEKEFAKIRHEATCVMKALTYIRKAMEDDPTADLVVEDEERPAKRRAAAA
jgi:hypothetical protein